MIVSNKGPPAKNAYNEQIDTFNSPKKVIHMATKFVTQWNQAHKTQAENNLEPSMTVPDQSMTISEILDRHRRGLTIEHGKVPMYEGTDDYMPDLTGLDLAERHEEIKKLAEEAKAIKQRQDDSKRKKQETQQREKYFKEFSANNMGKDTPPGDTGGTDK